MIEGYDFTGDRFEELLVRRFFPEKTDHESALLLVFLVDYLRQFDRVSFSVRIGAGVTPDPEHDPSVQRAAVFSSKRRIDFVGWQGQQASLVELKTRVGHAVMGQLLSDRQLWLEEFPDAPEPRLVAVGRTSTDDDVRVLTSHGIDVMLYPEADALGGTSAGAQ